MELSSLTAVSPIDGRYSNKTNILSNYYSEFALIKYRVKVEIEYFIALCELPLPQLESIDKAIFPKLRDIYNNFSVENAQEVKDIDSVNEGSHPLLQKLITLLNEDAAKWIDIPMLAKTHGQPASPTRLGKEVKVFAYRLEQQVELLKQVPISGKFGGATGNFNAHHLAFPHVDWREFANSFLLNKLGIRREEWTTQISNYDNLAALFNALARINSILIDLDRDFWQYISMEYFKQKIKEGEVGSSAMPHKVNPIDFENS